MSSVISSTGRRPALLIAGILLIATTLRVVFTGAAPLLDAIRSDYGLTTAQTGLLTTLPLLAFGLVSPLAAGVARRFGMERSLLLAMLLICAGIALRSLPSAALLFIGTAAIGCGIALGNVLLPGLIKRDFSQHVARMTGAYSLTMGGAAALGSALVVPVAMAGFGWRGALLLLMVFPLLAILSWLPSILQSMGYSEAQAGSLHGLLQLATAAPGLAIPLILHRLRDQRGIAVLVALMCAISAAGLWLLPGLAIGWTLLFGFGSGATMILGLTFIGLRASSAHQAAALSGMAQSVGYLLAACGPPLMGKIHDANGDWHIPLLAVALISLVMAVCGALAGRDREIHS